MASEPNEVSGTDVVVFGQCGPQEFETPVPQGPEVCVWRLFEGQLPGPFDFFLRLVNTGAIDPADEAVPTTVTGDGRVQLSDPHQMTKQVVPGVAAVGI